jgi:branched-chain amino acid transport system substrate-binding protein
MHQKLRWLFVAPMIFLLLVLPQLASTASSSGTEKIVEIGAPLCVSGVAAGWGLPVANGLQILVQEKNATGGLMIGGERYKVELVVEDTLFTPDGAAAAVHKLISRDKVRFMVGAIGGHEALAAAPILEKSGVLLITVAFAEGVLGPQHRHIFRRDPSSPELVPILYTWMKKNWPEVKRLALMPPNDETGRDNMKYALLFAPTVGLKVVTKEFYEQGTMEFTALLRKILSLNPDAIDIGSSLPQTGGLIVKQARQLGFKGRFIVIGASPGEALVEIAGAENAEGLIAFGSVTEGPMATDMAKSHRAAYIKKYKEWNNIASVSDFGILSLFEAIEEAGTLEVDPVIRVLESGRTFDSVYGPGFYDRAEFYGVPHQGMFTTSVIQIQNGKSDAVDVVTPEMQRDLFKGLGWKAGM